MIGADQFMKNLVEADFAKTYYSYCEEYCSSLSFTKLRPRRIDVIACLKELGHAFRPSAADCAFVGMSIHDGYEVRYGFAFQSTGLLECFFGWRQSDEIYVGGNFCVLAEQLQISAGRSLVEPPYPRPCFCEPERLQPLLSEWNLLHNILKEAAQL